jgi:hypothetical protein
MGTAGRSREHGCLVASSGLCVRAPDSRPTWDERPDTGQCDCARSVGECVFLRFVLDDLRGARAGAFVHPPLITRVTRDASMSAAMALRTRISRPERAFVALSRNASA